LIVIRLDRLRFFVGACVGSGFGRAGDETLSFPGSKARLKPLADGRVCDLWYDRDDQVKELA